MAGNLRTITAHIYCEMLLAGCKNNSFILNFFPCLPKENMDRKLGERVRDMSLHKLSICLSQRFVLMRFELYLG